MICSAVATSTSWKRRCPISLFLQSPTAKDRATRFTVVPAFASEADSDCKVCLQSFLSKRKNLSNKLAIYFYIPPSRQKMLIKFLEQIFAEYFYSLRWCAQQNITILLYRQLMYCFKNTILFWLGAKTHNCAKNFDRTETRNAKAPSRLQIKQARTTATEQVFANVAKMTLCKNVRFGNNSLLERCNIKPKQNKTACVRSLASISIMFCSACLISGYLR